MKNKELKIWISVAATASSLLVIFLLLSLSSFGRYMPATHGDWAMHAATTRAIFLEEDFSSAIIKTTLNEFSVYPKLTYWMAARLAHLTNSSPLQGLTFIVILSVVFSCLFYALRLCFIIVDRKPKFLLIPLSIIGILFSVEYLEVGFRDAVISNSFISQIASIAIAQCVLFIASRVYGIRNLSILLVLSSWILINTHIIGFVWCTSSLIMMVIGLENVRLKVRSAIFLGGIIIAAALILTSPGVLEMIKISGTGGDLRFLHGKNLPDEKMLIYFLLSAYLIMFLFVVRQYSAGQIRIHDIFRFGSGFLAIGPLILISAITVLYKGGNWYPVAKWIYLFIPEFILFIILTFSISPVKDASIKVRILSIPAFLSILFFVQLPFYNPKIDLQPAILAEQGVESLAATGVRRYPGLNVDHPALNYFIARSILKIPGDKTTHLWMDNVAHSSNFLGPEYFVAVAPTLSPGETIYFRAGNANAQRMITNTWWNLESDHVWAASTPATLFFFTSASPKTIRWSFVPHMPKGPRLRKYSVYVNDKKMPDIVAETMDWAHPATYSLNVPADIGDKAKRMKIVIEWNSVDKDDLGLALISLKYE